MRKKAIVTGASRGIGRGIIRELAAAGYDIAFSYRTREDEAKEAAEEIRNMGSFAWYAKADMAQAGAKDPGKISEAFAVAASLL